MTLVTKHRFRTTVGIVKKFEERGTLVLSCGTCLEYYDRKDMLIVGSVTTMKDTADSMLNFKRVISLWELNNCLCDLGIASIADFFADYRLPAFDFSI